MQRHHTGSGRRTVIPTTWGLDHAATAAGTMNATVSLRAPGTTPVWNDTDKRTEVADNTPFATGIAATVRAVGGSGTQDVVEEQLVIAGYMVSMDRRATGVDSVVVNSEQNTLIDVTACDDPLLVGKTLTAQDIIRSSVRFTRDVLCQFND